MAFAFKTEAKKEGSSMGGALEGLGLQSGRMPFKLGQESGFMIVWNVSLAPDQRKGNKIQVAWSCVLLG